MDGVDYIMWVLTISTNGAWSSSSIPASQLTISANSATQCGSFVWRRCDWKPVWVKLFAQAGQVTFRTWTHEAIGEREMYYGVNLERGSSSSYCKQTWAILACENSSWNKHILTVNFFLRPSPYPLVLSLFKLFPSPTIQPSFILTIF